MARHYLENQSLSGSTLPAPYEIDYRPLPNLGGDVIVPLLLVLLEPSVACKAFLISSAVAYWLGASLFVLHCGNYRHSAVLASLLLLPWNLNTYFFWGYLNFYSGMGIAFLVFMHHVWMTTTHRLRAAHFAVHTAMVTLLFLWHLVPWGVYCILVGTYHVGGGVERYLLCRDTSVVKESFSRLTWAFFTILPSLVLWASFDHTWATHNSEYFWGGWPRKWHDLCIPFAGYWRRISLVCLVLWCGAIVALYRIRGSDVLRFRWFHMTTFAILVLYILLPFQFRDTADVDTRLLSPLLVVAVATLACLQARWTRIGLLILTVCIGIRYASIAHTWSSWKPEMDSRARAIEMLPTECRVMPVTLGYDNPGIHNWEWGFAAWAVVEKNAFVPTLFANPSQQPLRIQDGWRVYVSEESGHCQIDAPSVRQYYDYVWLENLSSETVVIPSEWRCVHADGAFSLWHVQ